MYTCISFLSAHVPLIDAHTYSSIHAYIYFPLTKLTIMDMCFWNFISVELKWHTNEQVQWPGGKM